MAAEGDSCFRGLLYYLKLYRMADFLTALLFGGTGFLVAHFLKPFCRSFSVNDPSINNTFVHNSTFPTWSLFPVCFIPVFFFVAIELMRMKFSSKGEWYLDVKDSALQVESAHLENALDPGTVYRREGGQCGKAGGDDTRFMLGEECGVVARRSFVVKQVIVHWILVVFFSVMFQLGIVDLVKVYAGVLRPDFLGRLRSAKEDPNSEKVIQCNVEKEGRLSFPSGHSSCAFAALTPLAIYLLGVQKVFNGGPLWKVVVGLWPIFFALVIAVSRTRDNRHHTSDIIAGSIIGMLTSFLSVSVLFRFSERGAYLVPRRVVFLLPRAGRSAGGDAP
uniref:Uncharacterized protein TCIL3000_10_11760 n=1 Tax=Trypanosoma congolense (strain IL3000) TaxID=1068625 RepID=G0UYC8_TRYCI|nr:unnamed protein product [Trypanosoma congolense IL3000]